MPRKGLIIPEALEVFNNLPSDIECDEPLLSKAENVMTVKSSSRENTDIDEEKDDIRVPGPSLYLKLLGKIKRLLRSAISLLLNKEGPQMQ
ncbi:uncharacterized protein TNCV_819141 [Trichonephila clavipes]|nr:uncharacterized protein TNCV_819141 [Trichonephila clavipes]